MLQTHPRRAPVSTLVRDAKLGDRRAWDALVARYGGMVWAVARAHRLSDADAADASQATWLKLLEHVGDIKDPQAVGGWLATTARRECLRILRHAGRGDRALLRMLAADPAPSYQEIGAALGMPVGSIGPTRARALARLYRAVDRLGVPAAEALR